MILIFTFANLVSVFGFFTAAVTLAPRTGIGRALKLAWLVTFLSTALSHLTLIYLVLFYPGSRIDEVLGSVWGMGLQVSTAVGIWALLVCVYLRVGKLAHPGS